MIIKPWKHEAQTWYLSPIFQEIFPVKQNLINMKKAPIVILLLLIAIFFASCRQEKGKVQIQNKVHNVKLESINWGNYSLASSLLPGATSSVKEIIDDKEAFPKSYKVEFVMVGDGNRVLLKTKEYYELDYDNTLKIVITDSTEVVNPLEY